MMAVMDLVANGAAINWILGLIVAEGALLLAIRSRTHSGLPNLAILSLLLPGACLLLALRCALTSAGSASIAAFLLAAFVAHITDVTVRWGAAAKRTGQP